MKLMILITILISSASAFAAKPFSNLDTYKNALGFANYYSQQNSGKRLKIAVLDKGFAGYKNEIGKTLPAKTRYVAGPVAAPENLNVEHGLKMAQILTALLTNDMAATQWMPELTLYNVYGFTNFKTAIDDVIAQNVDLVLYSEVWEYGSNFDGAGFINEEVNRATGAGVIWVNAAGNFALTTYNSKISSGADDWVKLPNPNNSVIIRCEAAKDATCPVKVVLSWNDFSNDVEQGTNKDLDLALTDDLLNIVQTSALKQSADVNENRPGYSKYPREIIAATLKPGTYYVRVKNRSDNFTTRDQLRITVDGENIVMPAATPNESILNPADNPRSITVGALDSERSSRSQSLDKPDMLAPSSIKLQNGTEYRGSSNSAAIVAAGLAILKSLEPRMTRVDLLNAATNKDSWDKPGGVSLNLLGFGPTGHGCFADALINVPAYLNDVLQKGGALVYTTAGIRVMTPFDPITLDAKLQRRLLNDMVVALPTGGYAMYPRRSGIPAGAVEVFQRPLEAGLCIPRYVNGKYFKL